jgi:NitT/TauT family transport system substrate-binding protein
MNLKKFLRGFLAVATSVALVAVTGCGSGSSSDTSTSDSTDSSSTSTTDDDFVLKVALNNSLCEAPIQMGVELGFFEAEGLNVELVKVDAAQMPEAIGSGQVDAGFGLLGKYLQPIDNGLDIKITAGIHTGCIKVLVPEDSDIQTVEDLKGKTVGTTGLGAAAPTIVTRRSLYHAGLNASADNCDVNFVVYSGSDLAQALANGAVDAIANGDPQASIAQQEYNLRAIIDTTSDEEYKNEYCCISFVTGDIAENHPDIADKFTTAVMKSAQYVEEHPEEVAKIQVEKEYVAGDADFNASILATYNYKPSVDGGYEALKITVPDLQAIGLISADRDPDEFIDSIVYRSDNLSDESILGSDTTSDTNSDTNDDTNNDDNSAEIGAESLADCCN